MSKQIAAMKEQGVRIWAVYLDDAYVVFENGLVLPITGFYDGEHNEVEDLDDACYYEAGDDEHGFVACPMPKELGTFH